MKEKNLATTQNVVRFRQSWNLWTKNWTVPKRENNEGKWEGVSYESLKPIVTKVDGFAFAIYRMQKVMNKIKDSHGRPVWKVNKMSRSYSTWNGMRYQVFQFDCHRIAHGIIGGMNTRGASKCRDVTEEASNANTTRAIISAAVLLVGTGL